MELYSKRFKVAKKETAQTVPFSPELRDFITESRKGQTLYSNYEDFSGRKIFQFDQKNSLQEFIAGAVFFHRLIDKTKELSENEKKTVSQLSKEIITIGKLFNETEIHFTVIWIYYFSYKENTSAFFPVFKISKQSKGSGAIFVDPFLRHYDNWDYFIENAEMPEAFLCAPRHGEYNFKQDQLDLEYLLSKCLRDNLNARKSSVPSITVGFKPFSQVLVHPFLSKINLDTVCWKKILVRSAFIATIAAVCVRKFGFGASLKEMERLLLMTGISQYLGKLNIVKVIEECETLLKALENSEKDWIKIFESISILSKYFQALD